VFRFEQTATSLPDLFRALPDLEYIPDRPGLRGRAFRLGRPFAVDADKKAASPRRLGKREEASQEEFAGLRGTQAGLNLPALSFEQIVVLPLGNRSILSLVRRLAMSGLT
jgi:hypothetical protein